MPFKYDSAVGTKNLVNHAVEHLVVCNRSLNTLKKPLTEEGGKWETSGRSQQAYPHSMNFIFIAVL